MVFAIKGFRRFLFSTQNEHVSRVYQSLCDPCDRSAFSNRCVFFSLFQRHTIYSLGYPTFGCAVRHPFVPRFVDSALLLVPTQRWPEVARCGRLASRDYARGVYDKRFTCRVQNARCLAELCLPGERKSPAKRLTPKTRVLGH